MTWGPARETASSFGADNITLNLNGRTISGTPGPGNGNTAGVRLPNRTGVTVTGLPGGSGMKGAITGFDAGVFINRGSGNTIQNLAVTDNVGPADTDALLGDGIAVFYSANNKILNNLLARNGVYDGIGILGLGSDNNLIQGNTVEDTVGFFDRYNPSFQGHGIVITHFLNADDPRGHSIFNNNVIDNTLRRNFTAGLSMVSNVNGRITGNTIEENGAPRRNQSYAIGVTTGDEAIKETRLLVEGNKLNRNGQAGIWVERGASENQIVRNAVNENGFFGVVMGAAAPNNLIAENIALGNGRLDLLDFVGAFRDDPNCQGNIWRDNIYGTAAPECAANGTQVDDPSQYLSPEPAEPRTTNPSAGEPPPGWERALEHSELPPRPKAPRN
ncbi:MAG TPA: right-handed parallel beta-helix repeat-containing protein [Acidimicrobiales bacterium]|nr:right-handed parallel beta-helix repeat-containing protein [Acidimicrobiales bacterium]